MEQYSGGEVTLNDEEYLIMKEEDPVPLLRRFLSR